MKTFTLLFVSLFFITKISGQSFDSFEKYRQQVEKIINHSDHGHKTRSIKQRLLVDSMYFKDSINFEFQSSTFYFYSNGRGSIQGNNPNYYVVDCQSDSSFSYFANFPVEKMANKYDAQNKLIENTRSVYSAILQQFVPKNKSVISYTGFDKIDSVQYFEFFVNVWKPTTTFKYYYNVNQELEMVLQTGDHGLGWDSISRIEFEYIANQKSSSTEYDYKFAAWKIVNHNTFMYNAQNKITINKIFSGWNGLNFLDTAVNTYTYDTLNRLDSLIYAAWSKNDSTWYQTFYKYTYIGMDTFAAKCIHYSNNQPFNTSNYTFDLNHNLVMTKFFQHLQADTFRQYSVYHYEDYNPNLVDEYDQNLSAFTMYPNPANTTVTLSFEMKKPQEASISIIDLMGNLLYNRQQLCKVGSNVLSIPIANLSKGMYLTAINIQGQRSKYEKLVKE